MGSNFVGETLVFLILFGNSIAKQNNFDIVNDGSTLKLNLATRYDNIPYIQQMSILPHSKITFNITNVSSNVAFYIVQIHTYLSSVTLAYDPEYSKYVVGSNIGLFVRANLSNITQLFLKNDIDYSVKAMLVIIGYNDRAPIPGGCNMEFDTEIAPYEKVTTSDVMISVDVQPPSVPLIESAQQICEKNPVTLQMYQMFLPEQDKSAETYFASIEQMLTVADIMENGQEITSSVVTTPMRRIFSAYTGTGSVYVALATYGDYSAAYVPAVSFGCNLIADPESCQVLSDFYSKLVCACCSILGMLSVFGGCKYPVVDMTLPIFFTSTVISYMVVDQSITIAWIIGLCAAAIQILCSKFNAIFIGLSLGFFFACVTYFSLPENFIIMQNDAIFWTFFVTIILVVCTITWFVYPFTNANITRAIFGSFMLILPFDYFAGSCLKYMIINVVRRATVPDFGLAVINPPLQGKDITLSVFWVIFALLHLSKGIICKYRALSEERSPLLSSQNDP